ncbi:MAG: hypothetical protein ACR2MY_05285 [Candidatus Dormibacteria bacterium]
MSASPRAAGRRQSLAPLGVLLLLVVAAVSLQMRDHPQMSPIDELVHADYMIKMAHLELPRGGSLVGGEILREDACRRAPEIPDFRAPACSAPVLRPRDFVSQAGGYNSAAGLHPPTYYLATGLVARVLVTLTPIHSMVTAGRAVGILWLGGGVLLLWLALAELGVRPLARLIAAAPVVVTPVILTTNAFITNDATSMLVGAGLLLATLRWERARGPAWLVVGISVLAGATKVTNLFGVAALAVYLVVRAVGRDPRSLAPVDAPSRSRRQGIVLAVAMVGAGLATSVGWLIIAKGMAIPGHPPNPIDSMLHADHMTTQQLLAELTAALSPLGNGPILGPLAGHEIFVELARVLGLLAIGACVAAAAAAPAGSRREAIGLSGALLMAITGPAIVVISHYTSHTYFPVPARYGLVLVPLLVAALGFLLDKPVIRVLVGTFSAVTVTFTVVRLVTG